MELTYVFEVKRRAGRETILALAIRLVVALYVMTLAGPAFAGVFVGKELTDLKPEQRVMVAHPQPVQLLFQFQTKGAPNARATKFTKQTVLDTVKQSGLFSDITDGPAPNGAILSIIVNNVVKKQDMQNAEAKGFGTGLTLGLVGSNVWDHYTSQIDYVASPTASKITRTADHALAIQLGFITKAPPDGVPVEGGIKGAVFTMVRQIVANPLNALGADPAFQAAPASGMIPASAVAASAPASAAAPSAAGPATAPITDTKSAHPADPAPGDHGAPSPIPAAANPR